MNRREKTLLNGNVIYYFSLLANKLDELCKIQTLIHNDELIEAVSKSDEDLLKNLKEEKQEKVE